MNSQLATDTLTEVRWFFVGGWARYCGDCAFEYELPDPGSAHSLRRIVSTWCPLCRRWRQESVILMPMWELVGRLRINPPGSRRLAMHYMHYLDPALAFVVPEMP